MGKILIADDVKDMRALLGQVLESEGYEYEEAATGDEVIAILKDRASNFDLILLDIRMPKIDGLQALKLIRDISKTIKVCFVSGNKDKTVVAAAIKAGGNDYIVKPIDVAILSQKVKKLLGHSITDKFATVETKLKAKFPKVPIEVDMWVVELSELGLKFESPFLLKKNERVDLAIPKLASLIESDPIFACEIEDVFTNHEKNMHLVTCAFYGQHESIRTKLRALTMRGVKILEDEM